MSQEREDKSPLIVGALVGARCFSDPCTHIFRFITYPNDLDYYVITLSGKDKTEMNELISQAFCKILTSFMRDEDYIVFNIHMMGREPYEPILMKSLEFLKVPDALK